MLARLDTNWKWIILFQPVGHLVEVAWTPLHGSGLAAQHAFHGRLARGPINFTQKPVKSQITHIHKFIDLVEEMMRLNGYSGV
jgi:hypothetical protein